MIGASQNGRIQQDDRPEDSPLDERVRGVEWFTPQKYIDAIYGVMGGIDLDPASCLEANKVVKAKKIFTKEENGLVKSWAGRVFLNSPKGKERSMFAKKLYENFKSGYVSESIILLPNTCTENKWFKPLFDGVLCFVRGRIKFDSSDSYNEGSPSHGNIFIYFGQNKRRFAEVFSKFGNIMAGISTSESKRRGGN
jgi:hypothetical protein